MKKIYFTVFLTFFYVGFINAQTFDWVKKIQSTSTERIVDIEVDNAQNIVYAGEYLDTIDLNPNAGTFLVHPDSPWNQGAYITKLDSAGNFLWCDTFRSPGAYVWVNAITVDENDNYYITGAFRGAVDFDPGPGTVIKNSGTKSVIFFLKVSQTGALQWVKVLNGNSNGFDYGFDIKFSKTYGLILSGTCYNTVDFDPGPGVFNITRPNRDAFVAKYDFDGELIWAKTYGGDGPEESNVLTVDSAGSIYLAGQFSQQCDFDPGPNVIMPYPNMAEYLYLSKLDKDGNFKWVRCFVGQGSSSYAFDIDYDRGKNVYVVGGYQGTLDFNPNGDNGIMTSSQYSSAYAVKYDTAGNYKWSFDFDYSYAYACDIDKHGDLYMAGHYFLQPIDIDPGPNVYTMPLTGFWESYICKFTPDSALTWATHFTTTSTNMTQRHSSISSIDVDNAGSVYSVGIFNTPVDVDPSLNNVTITNINGSDDNFVHKFTQPCYLWDSVQLQNQTLTSMESNANYQWYNCDAQTIVAGATAISYTPTSSGNYAVILSTPHCTDTSDCIFVEIPVSVRDVALSKSVLVYPNPSNGRYQLEVPQQLVGMRYAIMDNQGRTISNGTIKSKSSSLHITVASGIYLLQITDKSGNAAIKKLIVE